MTRKQRAAPTAPRDRLMTRLLNQPPSFSTVAQGAHEVSGPRSAQLQMQLGTQQAQPPEVVQQLQQARSRTNSEIITPIHAGEGPATASPAGQFNWLPVESKGDDVQALSTAQRPEISVSEPGTQGTEQSLLGHARVNPVDPSLPERNSPVNPVAVSALAILTNQIYAIESQVGAEKHRTAILGETLVRLQKQSDTLRSDRDAWEEKARQLEEELQGLRNNVPILNAVDNLPQQLTWDSISRLAAEQGQNRIGHDTHSIRGKLRFTGKYCQACSQRQFWCSTTDNRVACVPCTASNTVCSYTGAPPSAADGEPCFASLSGAIHTHIVPAAHGHAFEVRAGSRFRIVDLHGEQVVDFMAWCLPFATSREHLSMAYTRHALRGSAPPQVGECLYTNRDEPMFRLVADTVKTHDMLYMACNPGFYARLGHDGHRSCATNVAEAMKPWGMQSWLEVVDPFNVFQNTPYFTLKALGCSRAGDYVELEALKDAVCAVSSCPYDGDGFNGGKVTEVAIVTGI